IFFLGAGLGLVMQTIVLAVQNSVDPHEIGTATSANNFFREIGAAVGVALFSTIFTTRLYDNLVPVFVGAPEGGEVGPSSLTPEIVHSLPEPQQTAVIDAFADALAPAFWYIVPVIALGFFLALFLREVKLSETAGLVARGEAVAERVDDGEFAPILRSGEDVEGRVHAADTEEHDGGSTGGSPRDAEAVDVGARQPG